VLCCRASLKLMSRCAISEHFHHDAVRGHLYRSPQPRLLALSNWPSAHQTQFGARQHYRHDEMRVLVPVSLLIAWSTF
jgi:hypothetical protein